MVLLAWAARALDLIAPVALVVVVVLVVAGHQTFAAAYLGDLMSGTIDLMAAIQSEEFFFCIIISFFRSNKLNLVGCALYIGEVHTYRIRLECGLSGLRR